MRSSLFVCDDTNTNDSLVAMLSGAMQQSDGFRPQMMSPMLEVGLTGVTRRSRLGRWLLLVVSRSISCTAKL